MEYTVSVIHRDDPRAVRQLDMLLQKEQIQRDQNLDYTIGLYDDEFRLVATGSCFHNTLRCMAVDSAHRGEGLLNQVVSHLVQYQCGRGNTDLFLYTKYETAHFFQKLGFYEIARAGGRVVFMENRKDGFQAYLQRLQASGGHGNQAAAVLNANPFTLGHQSLLERASAACDTLHVFIVSEDVSVIPYSVRERLVKEGTAHLHNLIYHQTGNYMISNATFPSYFLKEPSDAVSAHAQLDVAVFIRIAKVLGIQARYVGEEPYSVTTQIYNQILKKDLKRAGIHCMILPRKKMEGRAISATTVRECLRRNDFKQVQKLVPQSTYDYFQSDAAGPVMERLRHRGYEIHD